MSRILVIDDERVIGELMREILERAGHETTGAEDPAAALELVEDETVELVVSDIVMPGLTGLQLLDEVRTRRPSLPVILVTGAGTYENLSEAVARGADGLVIKPFSHADLQNAVAGALERARRTELDLRERLLAPTLAAALAGAIEVRAGQLDGHCERLGNLAARVAKRLGLSAQEIEHVRLGALLHDVGKIGIPDRVLEQDGLFTDEERALMRAHPLIGERLLEPLDFLPDVRAIVRHHHERWDGRGYPDGLAETAIPLAARIVTLADAVEAMSTPRPYRPPLGRDAIVAELRAGRGTQWDPRVVDSALELIETDELSLDGDGLVLRRDSRAAAPAPLSVLLVDADERHAARAVDTIERSIANVRVVHAEGAAEATELCRSSQWALAVVDHELGDGEGLDLLTQLKERIPSLPVLLLSREGSEQIGLEAFRRGAADYVVENDGHFGELTERIRAFLEAA